MRTVVCYFDKEDVVIDKQPISDDVASMLTSIDLPGFAVNFVLNRSFSITYAKSGKLPNKMYEALWKQALIPLMKQTGIKFLKIPSFIGVPEGVSDMYVYGYPFGLEDVAGWFVYTAKNNSTTVGVVSVQRQNDEIVVRDWEVDDELKGIGFGKRLLSCALKEFVADTGKVSKISFRIPKDSIRTGEWLNSRVGAKFKESGNRVVATVDASKLLSYLGVSL